MELFTDKHAYEQFIHSYDGELRVRGRKAYHNGEQVAELDIQSKTEKMIAIL